MNFRPGKTTFMLSSFINAIKTKKRSIIFGKDYVVLSREVYDEMVEKIYPYKYQQIEFSRDDSHDWIKRMFTDTK